MNIGEKIKNLRTSKLMTQKELAGTEITRNMLSSIENGSATPSLATLKYLADRLGVSAGYLISDGENDEIYYKKYADYGNITEAFKKKEWAICRDLCAECLSDSADYELTYLLAKSSAELGIACFCDGNLKKTVSLFECVSECLPKMIFGAEDVVSEILPYRGVMLRISPTLEFDIDVLLGKNLIRINDIYAYEKALRDGYSVPSGFKWENEDFEYALSAKKLSDSGNFEAAVALYSHICENDTLPKPVMYLIFEDFERCCKETEDYKTAYELSQVKINLLEKMLAEN